MCQEWQESVRWSCAECQRDTSSSSPKEVHFLGSRLLLDQLCQQLIHGRAPLLQKLYDLQHHGLRNDVKN